MAKLLLIGYISTIDLYIFNTLKEGIMKEVLDIGALKETIRSFASERQWEKFHSPKNISMALSVEASELVEIFQWLSEKESYDIVKDNLVIEKVSDELADILVYLVRISDLLGIDLQDAITCKMKKNSLKYPVEKSKGNAKKYDEL